MSKKILENTTMNMDVKEDKLQHGVTVCSGTQWRKLKDIAKDIKGFSSAVLLTKMPHLVKGEMQ